MPGLTTKTFGSGDRRWLGSVHGLDAATSGSILISSLTEGTHYPNGFILAGIPLAEVSNTLKPFDKDGADGTEVLAGFLVEDVPINGDTKQNVAILRHGLIKYDLLPVLLGASPLTIATTGSFVWLNTAG